MRTLIAGDGGSVLVAAATSTDASALACEGLASRTHAPSGVPVYPADAIPDDLSVDAVELLACEAVTGDSVRAWARAHGVACVSREPDVLERPPGARVVAVSAPSTGSGKTALVRRVTRSLARSGERVAVARHPIANLLSWDRFAPVVVRTPVDLAALAGPLEEREELAPLVGAGIACVSGLDAEGVLRVAAREASTIVWDGGGAALPWVAADLHLVVIDLLRGLPDDARDRVRAADAVVLTKADAVSEDRARDVEARVRGIVGDVPIVLCDLVVKVQDGPGLMDRRAVVVEDWASLALGGLRGGAGVVAARRFRCGVVDPRPFAVGAVRTSLAALPHLDGVIPSLGRTPGEIADLVATVRATPGDVVLWASNADPNGLIADEPRPVIRAFGELVEVAGPSLSEVLAPPP